MNYTPLPRRKPWYRKQQVRWVTTKINDVSFIYRDYPVTFEDLKREYCNHG
jgi:hypothetical protein